VPAQCQHALAGVGGNQALVDQRLQSDGESQRAQRGHHQEKRGHCDAAAVRPQKGQQA